MDDPKLIKKKQIFLLFGGVLTFIFILVGGMWLSDPNRGKPTALELSQEKARELVANYETPSKSAISEEESWIARSEKEIKMLEMQNNNLLSVLEQLKEKIETLEHEKKEIGTQISANRGLPFQPSTENLSALGIPPSPVIVDKVVRDMLPSKIDEEKKQSVEGIEVIDLTPTESKKKLDKNVSHYLPAGTLATVVLVSGMDAPTGGQAQSDPMPIMMRLVNDGKLPNFFESGIKNCHIIGAGYGDIASERAYIRLEKLSCVMMDGYIVEAVMKGYVNGEDGKSGFRGNVVSKQGSLIAKSLFAGLFSGMGASIAQQSQQVTSSPLGPVTTIDPKKVGQAGLANGAATSLDKVADYYLKRANEVFPIIEIASERIGEIILTDGTDLGIDFIENKGVGDK